MRTFSFIPAGAAASLFPPPMNRAAVLLCSLAVLGCVSVNKSVLTDAYKLSPVPKEDVHVFFANDSIPEHTRVAILYAEGSETFTTKGEMVDKLRKEAGKLGANAIILSEVKDPGTGEKIVAGIFGTSAERKGQAIAVYCPSLDKRLKQNP